METIITGIIFVVIVIVSLAQKAQEAKRMKEQQGKKLTRDDLPEASRKMYGTPDVRQAKAKSPTDAGSHGQPVAPGKELFDALFGAQQDDDEDWEPIAQPPPRRELPQAAPPVEPARPQPQDVRRAVVTQQTPRTPPPQGPAPAPAPTRRPPAVPRQRAARAQQPATATRRRPRSQRPAQRRQPRRAARPKSTQVRAASRGAGPSFVLRSLDDVRRGIVMAEILGPPKGLE